MKTVGTPRWWLVGLLAFVLGMVGFTGTAWAATISTVAGNGTSGYSGDGLAATSAEFNGPSGVAVDPAGNLLITDFFNNRVRLVAATSCSSGCPYGLPSMTRGDIYTVAGDGTQGYSGDGVAATSAELSNPAKVAFDPRGNLLIADSGNSRVRVVAAASCSSACPYGLSAMAKGDIYTVAGDGTAGYSGDGAAATSAELNNASGVGVDPGGDLLIADTFNHRVRLVAAAGCSSGCPYKLPAMTKGDIYTIAGDGTAGSSGDGAAATSAELNNPIGLAVDRGGDLLIGDSFAHRVRLVAAVSCSSGCPYGLPAMTRGDIYTAAGNGTAGYSGDRAAATSAELNHSAGVVVDPGGDLLIADEFNNRVRLVAAASCSSGCAYGLPAMSKGDIYTIAGDGTQGYMGDGGAATSAELNHPAAVALDPAGDLLIADTGNNRVRVVTAAHLSVSAPTTGTAGSAIAASSISAVLSGGSSPTGTITFMVFGPQPSAPISCASGGRTVGKATVSGNATYHPSASFTPPSAGNYWWYASYTGDSSNNKAASTCGGSMARTVVRLPPPPRNTSRPVISGTPRDGHTLKTTHGTWSSPEKLSYAYQWQRCSRSGTACTNIKGAIRSSYKLTSTAIGHKITVVVSATDPQHQTRRAAAKAIGPVKA